MIASPEFVEGGCRNPWNIWNDWNVWNFPMIGIGLDGLGTAGRSSPLAVGKMQGFSFVAAADLMKAAREPSHKRS